MNFVFQVCLIVLLVLLNGYFVASEFALVSIRKTRVDELVKKGNKTAKVLQKALDRLENYISATQLGITLASLALGWIGEPALARFLEPLLRFLPGESVSFTANTLAVIIAFCIITFLQIVLGELVPKTIALQRSEATALVIITPLVIFSIIFRPFILLLNSTGNIVIKIFGLSNSTERQSIYSEEEVKMILRASSEGGIIPEKEVEMVNNVFQFGDIPVKVVMIPRTDILAFDITMSLKEIVKKIESHPHSRFPVFENSIDNIIGFVHVKDMYRELLKKGENVTLSKLDILRKIIIVPEVKKIDAVLQEMRKKRIHLAIVDDEFGGTAGLVTLEDIIESLVGEIEDEFDTPEKTIIKQEDGSYLIEGHALLIDITEKFHLSLKGQGYTTLGGLVFGILGHEPRIGDEVEISGFILEVQEIEGQRIKHIKLKRNK